MNPQDLNAFNTLRRAAGGILPLAPEQDIPKPATPLPWKFLGDHNVCSWDTCIARVYGLHRADDGTYLVHAANSYPDALHEKEAALALADALRMELRASREKCGKLEAALRTARIYVDTLNGQIFDREKQEQASAEVRAALNAQPAEAVEEGQKP